MSSRHQHAPKRRREMFAVIGLSGKSERPSQKGLSKALRYGRGNMATTAVAAHCVAASPFICFQLNLLCSPPRRATPPRPTSSLGALPVDCLELIAKGCSSDLGRFAAVSKTMRSVASPSSALWKEAYQAKHGDDADLDVLSSSLMRACVLREHPPKQM
jgi:hypothetical protein